MYVENHIISSESRVSGEMSCVALRSWWCIVMNARASTEEEKKGDSKGSSLCIIRAGV